MDSIKLKSFAKVNIGLQIRSQRTDGYHNIHTVFQELDLHDTINITKISGDWEIKTDNPNIPRDENNTCVKAFLELKKTYPQVDGMSIKLNKNIITGGGLGGGSSNAAAVLKGLNKLFILNMTEKQLEQVALSVGADVPFFIKGGTQIGDGIGERLTPVENSIDGYYLLVLPNIFISTKWAYQSMKKYLEEEIDRPNFAHFLEKKNLSKTIFENDFERIVIPTYPEIGDIKKGLIESGASFASLSGSGSTVFGIFNEEARAKNAELKFQKHYQTYLARPTNI